MNKNIDSNRVHVILSGGVGSRLWPLSTQSNPKQYIPIFDGKSLFQLAIENNRNICQKVMVIGNEQNHQLSVEQANKIEQNEIDFIVEALPRNTAAAIVFAALSIEEETLMLVTPSDHIINNLEKYHDAVSRAFQLAEEGYLVTFGIKPTKPETGYGYIRHKGNEVLSFHEKPNEIKAKEYILKGDYLWNSGIFCFRAKDILQEMETYRPDILDACKKVLEGRTSEFLDFDLSQQIPSESIDYAVMEKSKKLRVVPSSFNWSDLGSFESLYEYFTNKDSDYIIDNNLVIADDLHVEIVGMEGLVVVKNQNCLLILPKEMSQEVKTIYNKLENEKSHLIK